MTNSPSGSGCVDRFVTRRFLFEKMRSFGCSNIDDQMSYLKAFVEDQTKCPADKKDELNKKLSFFFSDFKKRWHDVKRTVDQFLKVNQQWLDASISFPYFDFVHKKRVGRPAKSFEECSERAKRLKTEELRSSHSSQELAFAAQMSLRAEGSTQAARIIKEVSFKSSKTAVIRESAELKSMPLSGDHALSLCVEAKLTRYQYNLIREKDKTMFPSYKTVQAAKQACYPVGSSIFVSEISAEVKVQELLDHTAIRLINVQKEVLEGQLNNNFTKLVLICKWGCDGSGQAEYKQKFTENDTATDTNVFISSFVPLRLVSENNTQVILWQNNTPSSTRYCRPIKFIFQRETEALIKSEKDYIDTQIKALKPLQFTVNDTEIEVRYVMLFTMVDGKICNALTETKSTQRCFICGLSSKDFNQLDKCLEVQAVESRFEFGLSILHAWIRFLECVIHVSYKLPLKQWQVSDPDSKKIVAMRKKAIQEAFKSEMGLIIDKPKQGLGNSNDGNTARRFFENVKKSAEITEFDETIMQRFKIILQTISSGLNINVEEFRKYCTQTAKLYIEKYSWYPMSPTVHKILIHGPDVVQKALLPIGQLSEEAQEARNKEFKRYRENFSRKTSRTATNQDIFNHLLVSSDPMITSLRKTPKKNVTKFDNEVLKLLEPILPEDSDSESDCSTDE